MARKPPKDGGVDMHPDGPEPSDAKAAKKPASSKTKKADLTKADEEKIASNQLTGTAREKLRSFVRRIEGLEEDKKEIADDIKEVYGVAKSSGFDTKALRRVIRERKIDAKDREDQLSMFDLYWDVCGDA